MVNEDYVSFETAKLLKEKGFNEYTYAYYLPNASFYLSPREIDNKNLYAQGCVSAPTIQMAMKWLREAHKIAINIGWGEVFEENYQWWCIILNQNNGEILRENEYHKTYEEACETAIRYCLMNLI